METKSKYNLITILGPTATGKTLLAANVSYHLGSAIISADSRQIYKCMDIGTGKDLKDYRVNDLEIPYYLVNICDAGVKYNVYEFQKDFSHVFNELRTKNQTPVMCGGSGMYIEAILKSYEMTAVPVNEELRTELEGKSDKELTEILCSYKVLHNTSDTTSRKRLIRAIEIENFKSKNPVNKIDSPQIKSLLIGIYFEREEVKKRITQRLEERIKSGMIEEVRQLLDRGIQPEDLIYYGLEYKFTTLYLTGKLNYNDFFNLLNIAIHQFSKRQMTWFRKMEREGYNIHWIDGRLPIEEKVNHVLSLLNS